MKPGLDELRQAYLAAQLRGDRREAVRLIVQDGLDRGFTASEVSEHVVRASQREIGRLWQENVIGIADEHMASAISHLALAQIFQRAEHAPPNGFRVYIACVEGELHELPARFVADALDTAGFDTRFLGASLPIDSLIRMVSDGRPDLLALSATMSFHNSALRETVARVRALPGKRIPIAIGGNATAWSPNLAKELGVDITASTAQDFVESAKKLLGVERAA